MEFTEEDIHINTIFDFCHNQRKELYPYLCMFCPRWLLVRQRTSDYQTQDCKCLVMFLCSNGLILMHTPSFIALEGQSPRKYNTKSETFSLFLLS